MAQYNRTGKKSATDAGGCCSLCCFRVIGSSHLHVLCFCGMASNIENTKHNLSVSGRNDQMGSETEYVFSVIRPIMRRR